MGEKRHDIFAIVIILLVIFIFFLEFSVQNLDSGLQTLTGRVVQENYTNSSEMDDLIDVTINESYSEDLFVDDVVEEIEPEIEPDQILLEPEPEEIIEEPEEQEPQLEEEIEELIEDIEDSNKVLEPVIDLIEETETVKVIVILKDNSQLEEAIAEDDLEGQKEEINEIQEEVLEDLDLREEVPDEIKLSISQAIIEEKEEDFEFEVEHEYATINAISGNVTVEGLAKLADNPNVEKVVPVLSFTISLDASIPFVNADTVNGMSVNGVNLNGTGQTVCVIDTGINYSHPAFGNRYLGGYDFINADSDPADDHGHGSHVAGIVASEDSTYTGVAPEAGIIAIKACNAAGDCDTGAVMAGVDWCINNASKFNISVITMSLGAGLFNSTYGELCINPPTCTVMEYNTCKNISDTYGLDNYPSDIFVSAAAGNDGESRLISMPACIENITSVGALVNAAPTIAGYSNRGDLLDIFAPGSNINSADHDSFGWVVKDGTSMATPHIAGAAALLNQYSLLKNHRNLTRYEIREILKRSSPTLVDGATGWTYPYLDIEAAINSMPDINETEDLVKHNNGSINYTGDINFYNVQYCIEFDDNLIIVKSTDPKCAAFNAVARVTLSNLHFNYIPAPYKDGVPCTTCTGFAYVGGNFSFDAPGFSNYTAGPNAQLGIYDDNDAQGGSQNKINGDQIYFYANYTNITSGAPIDNVSDGGVCNITFNVTPNGPFKMKYNLLSHLYYYDRAFISVDNYTWNVTCNATSFVNLTLSDDIEVKGGVVGININKTRITSSQANLSTTVTFRINITNNGNRPIINLSVVDTYNYSILNYTSSTIPPNSTGIGQVNFTNVTQGIPLNQGNSISFTISFTALNFSNTTNNVTVFGVNDVFDTVNDSDSDWVEVVNRLPVVQITNPVSGSKIQNNTLINFTSIVNDPDYGSIANDSIIWSSDVDGNFGNGTNVSYDNLSIGLHTITLNATDIDGGWAVDVITLNITVNTTNYAPIITITSPANQSLHTTGALVLFTATATDIEDGALSGNDVVWQSDVDGNFANGSSVFYLVVTNGTYNINVTATDSGNISVVDYLTIHVKFAPVAVIDSPNSGASYTSGKTINFVGNATDVEDGIINGTNLTWTSSRNGQFGTGEQVSTSSLNTGTHTITLRATDSDSFQGEDAITITVVSTSGGGGNSNSGSSGSSSGSSSISTTSFAPSSTTHTITTSQKKITLHAYDNIKLDVNDRIYTIEVSGVGEGHAFVEIGGISKYMYENTSVVMDINRDGVDDITVYMDSASDGEVVVKISKMSVAVASPRVEDGVSEEETTSSPLTEGSETAETIAGGIIEPEHAPVVAQSKSSGAPVGYLIIGLIILGGITGFFIIKHRGAGVSTENISKARDYGVKYKRMGYSDNQIKQQLDKFFTTNEIKKGLEAADKVILQNK